MHELGRGLRDARLRHGLELRQLEGRVRVPSKYLRALEWGRLDLLPSEEAARSILRVYAQALGLDPARYASKLEEEVATQATRLGDGAAPAAPASAPASVASPAGARSGWRRLRLSRQDGLASLVVLLPAASAVAALLTLAGGSGSSTRPLRSAGARSAAPAAPPPLAPRPATRPKPAVVAVRPPTRVASTDARPRARPAPSPRAVLRVTATSGDSWLLVRAGSSSGPVLYEGTLGRGSSVRFTRPRLWVRLGAASHLAVTVNGARPAVDLYGTLDAIVTPSGLAKVPLGGTASGG